MAAGDTCQEAIEYGDLGSHARPAESGTWYKFTAPRAGTFTFTYTRSTFGGMLVAHYSPDEACDEFTFGGIIFSFFTITESFNTALTKGQSFYFRTNNIDEPYTLAITGPAAPDTTDVNRTAVNQRPGGGTDYPFAAENFLAGRVLDLYLSYADPGCEYEFPFTLTVAGDVYTVTDANDAVVAAGDTADAQSTAWGSRTVYEWVDAATVLRVVVRADVLENGSGELDPRTANRLAARVDSLAVYTDLSGGRRKTGSVALTNGYNTDLTLVEPALADGGLYVKQVRLDVAPAGGLGRAPGCEELTPLVRSVNNVKADAGGNLLLTPGGGLDDGLCFRINLPTAVTAPGVAALTAANTIKIASDCAPCCTCDYFVRTYEGLRRMVAKWQTLTDNASDVRDTYHRNRERWLAQKACRQGRPLTLSALPLKACYLSVAATYCNMTGPCLKPLEIRLTVAASGPVPATFCSPGYINGSHTKGDEKYTPGTDVTVPGAEPVFVSTFPYTDPQDQAHFRFRVRVVGCDEGVPVKVTATVHVPDTLGATMPTIDDGSPWGSEYPTRWLEEIWVATIAAPPGFCCEDD